MREVACIELVDIVPNTQCPLLDNLIACAFSKTLPSRAPLNGIPEPFGPLNELSTLAECLSPTLTGLTRFDDPSGPLSHSID